MVKEKIHNDFSEMKIKQAISMLKEVFDKVNLNDNNTIFFNDLIQVIEREEKSLNKAYIRWNIVKDNLTKKQMDTLIDEL